MEKRDNLKEQVDLVGSTEERKVAASFQVGTPSFRVALVHFFLHGLRQRTVIIHLHTQTDAPLLQNINNVNTTILAANTAIRSSGYL